ncbi:MAG: hypothetical protein ACI37Z_02850 [Candidatus Gastranaerophilaceae bacterium]
MSKNVKNTLKKINKKIDSLISDKDAAEELKKELELLDNKDTLSDDVKDKLELIDKKLESVELSNNSLKELISSFSEGCVKTLDVTDESEKVEKFGLLLKEFEKIVNDAHKSQNNNDFSVIDSDNEILQNFKEELTFFQNELENRLNENSEGVENVVNTIISEVNEKILDLQETVDKCSENQINTVISDVKQLKSDVADVSEKIRHINVNAILRTEEKTDKLIDISQKAEQSIISEINALSSITAKSSLLDEKAKEAVETLKNEILLLKNHVYTQIKEVMSSLAVQSDIKLIAEDTLSKLRANGTETEIIRKNLKVLKQEDERHALLCSEIREILAELSEYELNENADKIDIIYENLSLLNNWVENFDKLSMGFGELREDFDYNSDKIDIIYENISYLNEWVKALNQFTSDIEEIKRQCYADATVPDKIKEIYENLSVVKDWGKKADALSLQVKALSVQIDETESTINSKNLSDMKKMFAQMNEDMANVSARTNKLIIESDKQNEEMKEHIFNLQEIIALLEQKSEDFGFDKVAGSLEYLENNSKRTSDFEEGMTESFVYVADWIDKAGVLLNAVKQQLTVLDKIQEQQDVQLQKATEDWDLEKSILEKILDFQNETKEELKDFVAKKHDELTENLIEVRKNIENVLEKQDNQNEQIATVREELTVNFEKLENIDLLSKFNLYSKNFAVFSSKVSDEFNMFQLQQEYALGQLQKLILQHDEQKENAEQLVKETVNQIRQLFEMYENQLFTVTSAQKKSEEELNNLSSLIQEINNNNIKIGESLKVVLEDIKANQNSVLAAQEELLSVEKDNAIKYSQKQMESNSSVESAYTVLQNSYAEINENLHTIADLIEQNEKNSQLRMVELSCEKADNDENAKDEEIKQLLSHIAEQNEVIVEKSLETEVLAEKINTMEAKLSSLEQYMGKLIEYLEED